MKRLILYFSILLLVQLNNLNAQILEFEQVMPASPAPQLLADFLAAHSGSTQFVDVDNDNDLDVFMTGHGARLFINDGHGNYLMRELTSSNTTPSARYFDFADIDNDGDVDLIMTRNISEYINATELYSNDGTGVFTEIADEYFVGVAYGGDVKFCDIDSDNDQDLMIIGERGDFVKVAKLYRNDGSGSFTLVPDTPFKPMRGKIKFADVDNDNDFDLFMIGSGVSILYLNDGAGNFTLKENTPFIGLTSGSLDLSDIDDDNDLDLVIAGDSIYSGYYHAFTKLYLNDGNANYTETNETTFEEVYNCAVVFADIDNDSDEDLIVTGGMFDQPYRITKLYLNDGDGIFSEKVDALLVGVSYSAVAFGDVDRDNDLDVLITGEDPYNWYSGRLYQNNGYGDFKEVTGMTFQRVVSGSGCFGDIDGDGFQDALIMGSHFGSNLARTNIYKNTGNGSFFESFVLPFEQLGNGTTNLVDTDNDGDLDVFLTGQNNERYVKLYENMGNDVFTEINDNPFVGVHYSAVAFADIDNDEDEDVIIIGQDESSHGNTNLYINKGNNSFAVDLVNQFEDVVYGAVAFADIDNDNDVDLLITGQNGNSSLSCILYLNDGTGSFTEVLDRTFDSVMYATISFADIDNDNDEDVLITGYNGDENIAKLYENTGDGTFTEIINTPFPGVRDGAVMFFDVDNDYDQDLLITGKSDESFISELYINNGAGSFSALTDLPFDGVNFSCVAYADIDNDSDNDILIIGHSEITHKGIVKIYRNLLYTVGEYENNRIVNEVSVFPNPSQTESRISYFLTNDTFTIIDLYDMSGRQILNIQRGMQSAGNKYLVIDLTGLPTGIYFCKMNLGDQVTSKKIVKY